uniref:Protein kinase, ATP binding site-containing protein n=1 Tax=Tanacetum cinerariifolium TaxID=118510 RepID=A0A6L2KGD4_TANCI|nr:protein kinase, ATP binding site-containing protein [Tanacetum cinerariifolium]
MSSSLNLEDFRIPLKELKRATKNFKHIEIRFWCKGKLSKRWQNRTAFIQRHNKEEYESHELEIGSWLHHEDITSFIGYCDEADDYIYMAYEYFDNNGNLSEFLNVDSHSFRMSWADRLKVCTRVAKVLNYLHSGVWEHGSVIHGNLKCKNILIDIDDMESIKVCGFKRSKLVPLNQPHQLHYCPEKLYRKRHTDPIYKETNLLNTGSDVYSFGVLMFDILHGTRGFGGHCRNNFDLHQLMNLVRGCDDNELYKLVDPNLKGEIDHRSLQIFTTLAYKCISFDIKERPKMNEIIKTIEKVSDITHSLGLSPEECSVRLTRTAVLDTSCGLYAVELDNHGSGLQNLLRTLGKLQIPIEEIRKVIGVEEFDRRISSKPCVMITHRGKFVDCCKYREFFFKHWIPQYPHDEEEDNKMLNELLLISSFHHENITPFVGFCCEDNNIIIATQYAVNRSLYLKLEIHDKNSYLAWAERLKICLGVARGLKCFHAGFGEQKVIHGDVKSKSILLYDNLESKIVGFGKSYLVPKSYPDTNVYLDGSGSLPYMDPFYRESGIPMVESNVYSFGVVLFQVLTGVLACKHPVEDERISMMNWVRRYNDEIDKLTDYRIRDEIDARSLSMFISIAYKCISFNLKDHPSMNQVVKRLEETLYIQENIVVEEHKERRRRFDAIITGGLTPPETKKKEPQPPQVRTHREGYLQIVASIEQYSDLGEMSLEEAIGRLKAYKERIKFKKGKQVNGQEKLMFTRHDNKGKNFKGRGRGKYKFSHNNNHEKFREEKKNRDTSSKKDDKDNFRKSRADHSKLTCY